MRFPARIRTMPPWYPWARAAVIAIIVALIGWGALELGQRYLGLQRLTIDQVIISGCRGERLADVQKTANKLCLGKPLFWFDAEKLRVNIESRRWVKGLIIRRDPPDRLSLVIEERRPLLWVVVPKGTYLMADDGVILDRLHPGNLLPIPVVSDPKSLEDKNLLKLVIAAGKLREKQADFYERLTEFRWNQKGPMVFLEGLNAPIYLSKRDPTKNIPDFQAIYLDRYAKSDSSAKVRYFDLRWDGDVVAADLADSATPKALSEGK